MCAFCKLVLIEDQYESKHLPYNGCTIKTVPVSLNYNEQLLQNVVMVTTMSIITVLGVSRVPYTHGTIMQGTHFAVKCVVVVVVVYMTIDECFVCPSFVLDKSIC